MFDYTTLVNVFQACASVAQTDAPLNNAPSANRCQSLAEKGLPQSTTEAEQAEEAQRIINDYGILPEQNFVQPSHAALFVPQSISVTYANAYGRFSVTDNLCGYSFGATDATGLPMPLPETSLATLFAASNGIPQPEEPTSSTIFPRAARAKTACRLPLPSGGWTRTSMERCACARFPRTAA